MADELKQLTQRIKNSADKRYALKDEAGVVQNVTISYEGGGGVGGSGDNIVVEGDNSLVILPKNWNTGVTRAELEAYFNSRLHEINPVYNVTQPVYIPIPVTWHPVYLVEGQSTTVPIKPTGVNTDYNYEVSQYGLSVATESNEAAILLRYNHYGYRYYYMTVLNRSTGDVINTYYYNSVQDGSIQANGFFAIQMAKDGSRFQVITGNPSATDSYNRSIALLFFERQSDGTYTQTGYDVVGSYDIKYTIPLLQSDSMNRTLVVQTKDYEDGGHTRLQAVYKMDETGTFSRINNIASYVRDSSDTFTVADAIISSDGNYLYYGLNNTKTQVSTYKFAKVKLTDTGTELGHGDTVPDDDIVTLELPYTISDQLYKKFNLYGNVTKFSADMANLFLNINDGKIYHYTLNEDEKSYSLFQQYDDGGARSVDISYDSSKLYISDRRYIKEYEIRESVSLNETDPFGDGSLKHLYNFDNNLNDSVGNANGSYDSATYIDNGVKIEAGDKIDFNEKLVNGTKYSISCKFKLPTLMTENNQAVSLLRQNNNGWNSEGLEFGIWHNEVSFTHCRGNSTDNGGVSHSINTTDYVTAVVTRDDLSIKLYINGELVDENNLVVNTSNNIINSVIGKYINGNIVIDKELIIDYMQIFDRTLTDDEVRQLYNAQG
jgi:hypothetical protein